MLLRFKTYSGQVMILNKKKVIADCTVLENVYLGADIYNLVLDAPEICEYAKPGQFVQLKVGTFIDPVLRIPISVGDVQGNHLTIIYRVVGDGTRTLSTYKKGSFINIIGPLGKGFLLEGKRPLLVGGGIGIAPLLYVAKQFSYPVEIVLAARCKEEIDAWLPMFETCVNKIHITTDDGSIGTKGNITAILPELLSTEKYDEVFTCGPGKMLEAVTSLTQQYSVSCQVSLEKYMSCGLGLCSSCSCSASDGRRVKVCINGPVFKAGEVAEL